MGKEKLAVDVSTEAKQKLKDLRSIKGESMTAIIERLINKEYAEFEERLNALRGE